MSPTGWRNWAGNQTAAGVSVVEPRGTEEIVAAVRRAAADGRRVKPIGTGHSFTAIGRPEDVQLRLDRHDGVLRIDTDAHLVTVQSGMPLHRLNQVLADAGFAMTNLGDIDRQTIAGATSTGTHGTGARFGGIATQIRELELVLADGTRLTCSAAENPEVFRVARVGLGALGVIASVTLAVEPAFGLRVQEGSMPLDEVLDRFDELADGHDHFEFFWFPHTGSTLVKRNDRVPLDAGLEPLSGLRHWWDDEFLSNTVFGATVALGRRVPALVPPINRVSARALGARAYTDRSHRVFVSSRRVRFTELEYAVPRAAAHDLVRGVQRAIERNGWRVAFPVEVRVARADDIPLSTAFGRETAYVAVHQPVGVDPEPYFRAVEAVAADLDGRPHWGKLHWLGVDDVRKRYPELDAFLAVRDRLDPEGRFANAYLDRVLGPAPRGSASPAT
jgi:L-gulonolactone oxidase